MQHIKAIFDLGNGYVKGAVISLEDQKHTVLVKEMIKTKGMRKGKLLDPSELTACLKDLLGTFHKKLGGDFIDEARITISHPEMVIERITESKRVMTGKIESEDCQHLSKVISEISHQPNLETLKIMPAYWTVDDNYRVSDPIGMEARKLEVAADVFSVPKNFYNSLVDVFDKIELNIADIVPSILCSSELLLDFDLKDLGTLLVDIGFNQTSYVVYENGYPILYGVVPYGGEDVTKDISIGLKIDIKEAETIKIEQGLYGNDQNTDPRLDLSFLNTIITARYEEIFEKINEKLVEIDKEGRLPGGVILLGGGAKLEGLENIAKESFKLATFLAKDRSGTLPEMSTNLQLLNLTGGYNWSEKYQDQKSGGFSLDWSWAKGIGKFFKDAFF